MSDFQDIFITDLDEERTQRNDRNNELIDFHFRLSAEPPIEWAEIFMEQLSVNRTTRKSLMETMDFGSNPNPEVIDAVIRSLWPLIVHKYESEIIWSAKERDLEKHFKALEKCISDTNQQYSRLVRQKLKQQARDRRSASSLRNRLFGKNKR